MQLFLESSVLVSNKLLRTNSSGFTLPELMVSITLLGIVAVGIVGGFTYYFANIVRNNLFVDMTVTSQDLLRATVEQLRYGAGVRQTNTISDANNPSGWNTSNENFVIIIAIPAVDASDNYIIDASTGSPYNNELVYFKQGATLYRRTLAHPDASGNSSQTSCPAVSSTPSCSADTELAEYVDDMVFTLYDQDNAVTTDALNARSVKIDLYMERDTFGEPLQLHNSIQVSLRNTF